MNSKWILSLVGVALMGSMLTAQLSAEQRGARADSITLKARRVDLLNQLLPLVLTKAQLDKILPAIEKARNEVRKAEVIEYDMLVKIEPKLDLAIKEALEEQKMTHEDIMKEAIATFKTIGMRRNAIVSDNTDMVMEVFEKELNAGQKKAAANALRPSLMAPDADPGKLSDEVKMRFFVQYIILDREAYDLMLTMSQKRK